MHLLLIILLFFLMLILIYLFCIRPNTSRRELLAPFESTYIAHRGYFDNHTDCPENSLPAFQRAVTHGYGIELDVQLTKDGQLIVFHDATLKRMCGISKKPDSCTYDELQAFRLNNTGYRIPLLTDVLKLVNGQVPLIIEIKPEGNCIKTARCLSEIMKNYTGIYCVESFHPGVIGWYKKNQPHILRGLLSTNFRKNKIKCDPFTGFLLTNLLFNRYAKPDFIAYNHLYANECSYRLCRRLYPVGNAAWTIRSQEELDTAQSTFTIFIFDSFQPQ